MFHYVRGHKFSHFINFSVCKFWKYCFPYKIYFYYIQFHVWRNNLKINQYSLRDIISLNTKTVIGITPSAAGIKCIRSFGKVTAAGRRLLAVPHWVKILSFPGSLRLSFLTKTTGLKTTHNPTGSTHLSDPQQLHNY